VDAPVDQGGGDGVVAEGLTSTAQGLFEVTTTLARS
jgi:hypothetical protein